MSKSCVTTISTIQTVLDILFRQITMLIKLHVGFVFGLVAFGGVGINRLGQLIELFSPDRNFPATGPWTELREVGNCAALAVALYNLCS